MKDRLDRIADWHGWRPLGALAVCMVIAVVLYVGWTVHQHNSQLNCIHLDFNQVLNELLHHATITAPPDC